MRGISKTHNMFHCGEFFESLFGHESIKNMHMYTWELSPGKGGVTRSFKCGDTDSARDYAIKKSQDPHYKEMYFGLALTHWPLQTNERVGVKGFDGITCLWLDIDFESPHRRKDRLPPDYASIESVFQGIPHPTWVIDSGYGMHMYWVFSSPYIAKTNSDRDTITLTIKRWNAIFKDRFARLGYNLDSTSAAQILRVPDTLNGKNLRDRKKVVVSECDPDNTHDFDDLFDLISVLSSGLDISTDTGDDELSKFSFKINRDACLSEDEIDMLEDSHKKFKRLWEGKQVFPSQSERDLALASYCRASGFSDQKVCDAIIHCRRNMNAQHKGNMKDYIARTLLKSSASSVVEQNRNTLVGAITERVVLRDDELQPDQEWVASSSETVVVEANGSVIDEILGFHVEALEKSPTTPPSYTLIFDFAGSKHRVIFSNIKELSTQAQFLVKIMEELDIFIPRLKKSKWEEAMSLLLPMAQTIEMIDGSSESQEIRIKLNMFLEARGSMLVDNDIDAPDDCFARHITTVDPRFMPYGLGDLIILINPRAFMTWHNREGFPERLSIQQTSVAFSRIRHKLVKFKGKQWVMFKGEDMGEGRIEIP